MNIMFQIQSDSPSVDLPAKELSNNVSRPPARFDPFQEPRDRNPAVSNLGDNGSVFETGSFNI
ncbi:hypothetical protein Hanom_Chr14g01281291 [Helianthus anomalus]